MSELSCKDCPVSGGGWLTGGAEPLRQDLPGGGHLRQEQARHLFKEEDQVLC